MYKIKHLMVGQTVFILSKGYIFWQAKRAEYV